MHLPFVLLLWISCLHLNWELAGMIGYIADICSSIDIKLEYKPKEPNAERSKKA